jgi:hypothetical protein
MQRWQAIEAGKRTRRRGNEQNRREQRATAMTSG